MPKHELPEVAIVGNENPIFLLSDAQDVDIGEPGRIILPDPNGIVTETVEMRDETASELWSSRNLMLPM